MRRYHCSDSLTFHDLAAGLYGRLIFLEYEWAAFPKKESGRPCTTLLGWYRNQWDALLGVLGVKANCGLIDDTVFGLCQSCLPRLWPLPLLHYLSLCHLFVVFISPSFHSLLQDLC